MRDYNLFAQYESHAYKVYTTFTNFSMKYLTMYKVYTDEGGIK